MLLLSLSFSKQCITCLLCVTCIGCVMGDKWLYSYCFIVCCFRISSKQHVAFLYSDHIAFSSSILFASNWCINTVVPHSHSLEEIPFFIMKKINFHITDNLLIVVHAFPICKLTSLSVDEILLLIYVNCSINFRSLPCKIVMASFVFT